MYGCRTPLSMKNQDTWDVAQKHSGFSMMILGVINGIFGSWSIIQPMAINKEIVQLLFLLIGTAGMIFIEEIHLRKLFNKDGSRKK
ncbi:SdpI family protein [Clostridium sp. ZS2-4]|uniref:SdpI family protein n=1 Tax=Clostridium sp. ZS2-4 TaxID=2987703 RepID=UPI00227BEA54|nr:SdpI family protein [Clostridium sp. ZS2-4]MCY6356429.1 SdpI family protein [Clostridium sp. ZS2-4]